MEPNNDPDVLIAAQWYRANPSLADCYCGEWVAIGPDGIIAHGTDLKAVSGEAAILSAKKPLLFKVPPKGVLALWVNRG